jgi:hypothetical protein
MLNAKHSLVLARAAAEFSSGCREPSGAVDKVIRETLERLATLLTFEIYRLALHIRATRLGAKDMPAAVLVKLFSTRETRDNHPFHPCAVIE